MPTARLATPHIPHQDGLRRAQKAILLTAAAVVLSALVAHHGGLGLLVALFAALALKLTERLTTPPTETSAPSPAQTRYRFADGGSFRTEEVVKKRREVRSVIVIDGGIKH